MVAPPTCDLCMITRSVNEVLQQFTISLSAFIRCTLFYGLLLLFLTSQNLKKISLPEVMVLDPVHVVLEGIIQSI